MLFWVKWALVCVQMHKGVYACVDVFSFFFFFTAQFYSLFHIAAGMEQPRENSVYTYGRGRDRLALDTRVESFIGTGYRLIQVDMEMWREKWGGGRLRQKGWREYGYSIYPLGTIFIFHHFTIQPPNPLVIFVFPFSISSPLSSSFTFPLRFYLRGILLQESTFIRFVRPPLSVATPRTSLLHLILIPYPYRHLSPLLYTYNIVFLREEKETLSLCHFKTIHLYTSFPLLYIPFFYANQCDQHFSFPLYTSRLSYHHHFSFNIYNIKFSTLIKAIVYKK